MSGHDGHIIILAGAPDASSLSWDEKSLHSGYELPVQRFLQQKTSQVAGPQDASQPTTSATASATMTPSRWRAVDMKDAGHILPPATLVDAPTQFLSFDADSLAVPIVNRAPEDFIEHSIAVLDNFDSSQLLPPVASQVDDSTLSSEATDTSYDTTSSVVLPSPLKSGPLPSSCALTDLKHIPNAAHISSLHPQTITINLIVGIIAVSPPRTIALRRRNAEMEIVEITVGDDTRAGFNVNFWLTPMDSQGRNSTDGLRQTLNRLRTGDVVLMRYVALSSFRDAVYGQSLPRRQFGRFNTSLDLLPAGGSADAVQGTQAPAFKAKLERVRAWTEQFVGVSAAPVSRAHGKREKGRLNELPPDTQD